MTSFRLLNGFRLYLFSIVFLAGDDLVRCSLLSERRVPYRLGLRPKLLLPQWRSVARRLSMFFGVGRKYVLSAKLGMPVKWPLPSS